MDLELKESTAMIEIKDLRFGYKRCPRLFDGLNLQIPAGRIVGLLGRNGEGKSTLMKLINGLLLPKGGELTVLGRESKQRSLELLQSIYLLGDEVRLPEISVSDYLSLYSAFYPTYQEHIAHELLEMFELKHAMQLGQMSFGQRKKTQIALALALQAPILLLDEPTNGLDIPSKSIFRRAMAQYCHSQQTIIISTHQVRDLEQIIDYLILMNGNQIVCNEPIARLDDCFVIDTVSGTQSGEVLYRETSILGEVGIFPRDKREEGHPFSIELFFNAMISSTEPMMATLERHRAEHPETEYSHLIDWLKDQEQTQ